MQLTAITREVSSSINNCELSFHARQPIDVAKAMAQHQAYQDCLAELGVRVISLPAKPELSDAVFVEDPTAARAPKPRSPRRPLSPSVKRVPSVVNPFSLQGERQVGRLP